MQIASFFARDEIRKYQETISTLQAEIARLRENGLAQAQELGADIRKLYSKSEELEGSSQLMQQELLDATKALDTARSNEQALCSKNEAQVQELNQRIEDLEMKLQESSEEGELLLLQLHQVQEELESVFLREQSATVQLGEKFAELESLKKRNEALITSEKNLLNEKSVLVAEHEKEQANALAEKTKAESAVAILTKEKQEIVAVRDARSKELTEVIIRCEEQVQFAQGETQKLLVTMAEKEQLRQRFEALAEEKKRLLSDCESMSAEVSRLSKERDEQVTHASTLQQELECLKAQIEGQVHEAQQENELLLLQLHQVQEELEHYFLEHQKFARANELQVQRWQRLESRLPNYLDCESIVPIAADSFSDEPSVEWRVTNVTVGGTAQAELSFTTFLRNGKPGLMLKSTDKSPNNTVTLVPRALSQPQAKEEIADFRNIRTSEWRLMLVAASAIEFYFSQGANAARGIPEDFDLAFWKQAILPIVSDIRSLPPVFRFEKVQLKRELIHTDYEHLWLILHDVSYGSKQQWPKFEVRLGAANVMPGAFSRQPKLELPRIDGKTVPFESWFEESYDDFGGKLELRFELTRKLFDVGVWTRLQSNDQRFMLALIGSLPLILSRLQSDKVAIARTWPEWIELANGMIDVLVQRLREAKARGSQETSMEASRTKLATTEKGSGTSQESSSVETKAQPAEVTVKSSEGIEEQAVTPIATLLDPDISKSDLLAKSFHSPRKKRHKGR